MDLFPLRRLRIDHIRKRSEAVQQCVGRDVRDARNGLECASRRCDARRSRTVRVVGITSEVACCAPLRQPMQPTRRVVEILGKRAIVERKTVRGLHFALHFVVSSQETSSFDLEPQPLEVHDDRRRLATVDDDPGHLRSFNRHVCRESAKPVSRARQLALSRSESA